MFEMRKLGRTGLEVTSLCLGTMTWGQQNTEAEGHAQLDLAIGPRHQLHRHGRDVFDPAPGRDAGLDRADHRHVAQGARRPRQARHRLEGQRTLICRLAPARRQGRAARRGQHPLRGRAIAEASADRLHRSLPAALARPAGEPLRGRRQRVPRSSEVRRCRADRRYARGPGPSRRGRQDPPHRPFERDGLGRVALPARVGSRARPSRGFDPERLQPREPHFEIGLAEFALREDVGLLAYSPLGQGTSRANTRRAPARPGHARRCSTAASATRSPAPRRQSKPIWRSPATSGWIRCIWRSPS